MTPWLKAWLHQTSSVGGDPTRRAKADVHNHCADAGQELVAEAKALSWHVVETTNHYIIIRSGEFKIRC